MTRTSVRRHPCPIARAASVIGDQWSLLILRDLLQGVSRFSELKRRIGAASNMLAIRLEALVAEDLVERCAVRPGVKRFRYRLTEKGRDLAPALVALMQWGDRWMFDPGTQPVSVRVRGTQEALAPMRVRTASGAPVEPEELEFKPAEARGSRERAGGAAARLQKVRNP